MKDKAVIIILLMIFTAILIVGATHYDSTRHEQRMKELDLIQTCIKRGVE